MALPCQSGAAPAEIQVLAAGHPVAKTPEPKRHDIDDAARSATPRVRAVGRAGGVAGPIAPARGIRARSRGEIRAARGSAWARVPAGSRSGARVAYRARDLRARAAPSISGGTTTRSSPRAREDRRFPQASGFAGLARSSLPTRKM